MKTAALLARDLRSVLEGGAWHGPALMELLADVDARRASARPVAGGHSIAELVAHSIAWLEIPGRRLAGAAWHDAPASEDWPPVPPVLDEAGWGALRGRLAQAGQALARQIESASEADLARPVKGAGSDVRFMLAGSVCHVVYHAGQVALLKRGL
jgi:uncharacterized damage-inducible protein DinB